MSGNGASASHILYGRPGSGSAACEAVLALTGLPARLVDVAREPDGAGRADLAAANPLGEVPTLVLPDGSIVTESAAICITLADAQPSSGLAPEIDDARRPAFTRWMVFLAANAYMTDLRVTYPQRYTTDAASAEAIRAAAKGRADAEWHVYARALADRPFMLGDNMSAVDIYAAMMAAWHSDRAALCARHPNVANTCRRVSSAPAVASVWARHGLAGRI